MKVGSLAAFGLVVLADFRARLRDGKASKQAGPE